MTDTKYPIHDKIRKLSETVAKYSKVPVEMSLSSEQRIQIIAEFDQLLAELALKNPAVDGEALEKAEAACLLLLKCGMVYTKGECGLEGGAYLAPKAFHPALDAAKAVVEAKIERKAARASTLKAAEPEGELVSKALKELLTAVKYAGLSELPNNSGQGYMARIPDTFVINAEKALSAPLKAAAGWRPISELPQTKGKQFILVADESPAPTIMVEWNLFSQEDWYETENGVYVDISDYTRFCELPAPPQPSNAGEE